MTELKITDDRKEDTTTGSKVLKSAQTTFTFMDQARVIQVLCVHRGGQNSPGLTFELVQ